MIETSNHSLTYCGGGLFTTTLPWVHPARTEETYEIIYMIRGTAYMEENGNPVTLEKGDLKIFSPHVPHKGIQESTPPTEFYWHHFKLGGDADTFLPQERLFRGVSGGVFPEMLHLENLAGKEAAEPALLYFLTNLKHTSDNSNKNRLANRIYEWARINADATLTVEKTAAHFGYHPEYISKLIKSSFGTGLKNILDSFILLRAKDLLDNSSYSVKEIAGILGFRDANLFVNFFKYHESTTPTKYRNRNFRIHMNAR